MRDLARHEQLLGVVGGRKRKRTGEQRVGSFTDNFGRICRRS
jgi:hypothetical protein